MAELLKPTSGRHRSPETEDGYSDPASVGVVSIGIAGSVTTTFSRVPTSDDGGGLVSLAGQCLGPEAGIQYAWQGDA